MTSKPQCLPIQPEPRTSNTCCRSQNDPSIGNHLRALRHREVGRYADRCVPVFLHLHGLRGDAAAEVRRLLRVLFIRLRSLPSDPSRAFGGNRCAALLRWIIIVATEAVETSRDWLRSPRTSALAWWLPQGAIVLGLLIPVPIRTSIWIVALIWMGTACILNAKRCGRTHCRYTGPYYLAMIVPVLALGSGILHADFLEWAALAVVTLLGAKVIWWATERAWGTFS